MSDAPRTPSGSLAPAYFDALYAEDPDPWAFATSPYEASKYAATLGALPNPRYDHALEVGCSIGVLTEQLAPRCRHLLGVDVAEAALEQARARCARFAHVRIERRSVPAETPPGPFDLVLVSEVGYYLGRTDLDHFRDQLAARLAPRGHLLLVHWTGETGYPLSGDAVHEAFLADPRFAPLSARPTPEYRLDLLGRVV